MREVKFRGMDIANNRWLYGNLEIPLINQRKSKYFIIGYSYGQYQKHEVYPKTVGQYTGLKDRDGTEIYEGDIIEEYDDGIYHWVVKWDEEYACFYLHEQNIGETFYLDDIVSVVNKGKVIGNTYEHHHLLESRTSGWKTMMFNTEG